MDEIVSLEKMVQKFVSENEKLEVEKSSLDKDIAKLTKENEILISKINDLEKQINQAEVNAEMVNSKAKLDLAEREKLKDQIDDLISRIDYHIRS